MPDKPGFLASPVPAQEFLRLTYAPKYRSIPVGKSGGEVVGLLKMSADGSISRSDWNDGGVEKEKLLRLITSCTHAVQ